MNARAYDVIIVGGGPAGLTAAWQLRDLDILLLEQSHRLGGRLYSIPKGDFWLNLGGHLCPAPGSYMRRLMADLGLDVLPIPGNKFALWHAGEVVLPGNVSLLPFRLPLSLTERVALARVGLRIRRAVRRWQVVVRPLPGESSEHRRARAARFLSDISFREFLGPMPPRIEAVFRAAGERSAAELEDISAGVGVALFGMVWAGKSDAMAVNMKGGSGRLGDVMTERLGDRALLHARVTNVESQGGMLRVTYEKDGRQCMTAGRQVIVAIPATAAADVVKGLPSAVQATLRRVHYGPFPSMGVITNETEPMPWDDVYAITVPGATINMMFHHTSPLRVPGARKSGSSFMVYSGGAPAAEMMKLTEDQIRERYLGDMYRIYPELRGIIQETKVQKWSPGNTFRPSGFSFDPVVAYCERADVDVHLAGDYFSEIGNMETASGTGHEAAQRVRTRLAAKSSERAVA